MQSQKFSGGYTRTSAMGGGDTLRNLPPARPKNVRATLIPSDWNQTPISARLASVPIVPVLRDDHCHARQKLEHC